MPNQLDKLYRRNRGASLLGYGLIVGLISVVALSAITTTGSQVNSLFGEVSGEMGNVVTSGATTGSATPQATPAVRTSCQDVAQIDSPGSGYAVHQIDPGGGAFDVLCYFDDGTFGRGGFTAILAQYELDPIAWDEGRQADYQPDLINSPGTSFALNGSDIPSHATLAFGRIGTGVNNVIDAVPYIYTTGNLGVDRVTSAYTANSYDIHRSDSATFAAHDPESSGGSLGEWLDSLTIDQTGGQQFTWAVSPNHTLRRSRGYAYSGLVTGSNQDYAWVLLVR